MLSGEAKYQLGYIAYNGICKYIDVANNDKQYILAQEMINYYKENWVISSAHLQQKLDEKIEELG